MTRQELNEEIARHLGFQEVSKGDWKRPAGWGKGWLPYRHIDRVPDFLDAIRKYYRIEKITDGGAGG